jgi:hypothetical protein
MQKDARNTTVVRSDVVVEFPVFRHVRLVLRTAPQGRAPDIGAKRRNVGGCQVASQASCFAQRRLERRTFLNGWTTNVVVTSYKALLLARKR